MTLVRCCSARDSRMMAECSSSGCRKRLLFSQRGSFDELVYVSRAAAMDARLSSKPSFTFSYSRSFRMKLNLCRIQRRVPFRDTSVSFPPSSSTTYSPSSAGIPSSGVSPVTALAGASGLGYVAVAASVTTSPAGALGSSPLAGAVGGSGSGSGRSGGVAGSSSAGGLVGVSGKISLGVALVLASAAVAPSFFLHFGCWLRPVMDEHSELPPIPVE
mmetsp:Transcript_79851/g.140926  ORF Transcript_79851/g.140926 Transcript_79851/m.140926 type:complete len:216 (+) Transcript_79851:1074-1721(+)